MKDFLTREAKETYGDGWAKRRLVKEVSVCEHKWYEIRPEKWVYSVTFYTSDEIEYYINGPQVTSADGSYAGFTRVEAGR